jgi:hypothetical protein
LEKGIEDLGELYTGWAVLLELAVDIWDLRSQTFVSLGSGEGHLGTMNLSVQEQFQSGLLFNSPLKSLLVQQDLVSWGNRQLRN